jgi:hypothetical protein
MGPVSVSARPIGSAYAVHPNIRFAVFVINLKDARRAKRLPGPERTNDKEHLDEHAIRFAALAGQLLPHYA